MGNLLSNVEIEKSLTELTGWVVDDGELSKEFRFKDFSEAFGFMTRAAMVAETMNHHPNWSNVWNKVAVRLSTHDAGGITEKDINLANAMDKLAGR